MIHSRISFDAFSTPRPTGFALDVLLENDTWFDTLRRELDDRGVAVVAHHADRASFDLDRRPRGILLNRVSPSAALRGHDVAVPYTHAVLQHLEAHGTRVLNGARSFRFETSKVAQHTYLQSRGVRTPRTVVFNAPDAVDGARLAALAFPLMIKPNCGGSGAFVRRVASPAELLEAIHDPQLTPPDGVRLLQEYVPPADGSVVRLEFIGDRFVYAMRAYAENTFNLCPADGCERPAANAADGAVPSVRFEPWLDVPDTVIDEARDLVRGAGFDVGGVEFIVRADGTRWYFDLNATSVYRDDISAAFGVDPWGMLAESVIDAAAELEIVTVRR